MKKFKTVVTLVIIGLVALFAVQNAAAVELQFIVWHFSMPRALLVLVLLAVGFLLGIIVSSLSSLKSK